MPNELNQEACIKAPSLSLDEGEERLSDAIESFAKKVNEYSSTSKNPAPQLAIKATAGLGKTTKIIEKLISYSALNKGDVHYYVPNHRLSKGVVKSISEELDFDFSEDEMFSRVKVIAGRGQKDDKGSSLCQKSELAELTASAGLSVAKSLCKNENSICEFYDNCAYQNQFEPEDMVWPENLPAELFNDVTVMTHANLFLHTNKRLRKPVLIVVDEAFYQGAISEMQVNAVELFRDENPISTAIIKHLMAGELKLLSKLRGLGHSEKDLLAEANLIDSIHQDDNQNYSLHPSLSSNKQQRLISEITIKKRASLILRAVAQELLIADRDECHSVSYDNYKDEVIIHGRRSLTIPEDIPTVFIDADVQEDILNQLRANVHYEKIPVERLATFHQFTGLTFNKLLLLNSDEETVKIQNEIKRFIRHIAPKAPTLVVCSKSIRSALTGEDRNNMGQESHLEGATIIHFGNLRGLNEYSNYRNVIILGREQPSAIDIEGAARGLWWDAKESIQFLPFVGKYKPFENKPRTYHLRDKSVKTVSTQTHPDKRVQLLLEQIRENETVQAIDRLRLLRPHKDGQRNVYILSSVPLDLTIDNLFSWTQLQKLVDLIDEADGIIPLNPKHLMKRCPINATSERTAKRLIKDLKEANPLICIYIREVALCSVEYRITNTGKYSKALVSEEIIPADRNRILSSMLGTDDIEVKIPTNNVY
jgi:hypothetical protein